ILGTMRLPADVTGVPHDPEKPDRSEVSYRMAWARTYLKKAGILHNPRRGVWALTDKGRSTDGVDSRGLASEVAAKMKLEKEPMSHPSSELSVDDDLPLDTPEDDEELLTARVPDELARKLLDVHRDMLADGSLLSRGEVNRCLSHFRERFGPDVLAGVDGEALLTKIHGRGSAKDSLVYWLEFKNDDEFPAGFGSIG